MRTVEQQEKMIQQARDNQWTMGNAILNSGLKIDDQEDLIAILQVNNHTDAFELYGMWDTIIRDRFMDMIEDTLYGSQRDSDASDSAECSFTQDELQMLSDAILCAIQANGTAAKLTTSPRAVTAIMEHNDRLRELNNKICGMMKGDEE